MILETQIIVISTSEHLHAKKKKSEFKPYTFHINLLKMEMDHGP